MDSGGGGGVQTAHWEGNWRGDSELKVIPLLGEEALERAGDDNLMNDLVLSTQ